MFPCTHQDPRVMHKEFHAAPDAQSIFEASTPAQAHVLLCRPSQAYYMAIPSIPERNMPVNQCRNMLSCTTCPVTVCAHATTHCSTHNILLVQQHTVTLPQV